MLDRCPHRAAALSEGRMTSSGDLQCAYHGMRMIALILNHNCLLQAKHVQASDTAVKCWMLLVKKAHHSTQHMCTGSIRQ